MENKTTIPSALRSEIQRFHNKQISERDALSSLSPPVYKRSASRSLVDEAQRPDQTETTQKINTERNIVEEYRQKIKAKLSESASHLMQTQSALYNYRGSSALAAPTGPSLTSTLN